MLTKMRVMTENYPSCDLSIESTIKKPRKSCAAVSFSLGTASHTYSSDPHCDENPGRTVGELLILPTQLSGRGVRLNGSSQVRVSVPVWWIYTADDS